MKNENTMVAIGNLSDAQNALANFPTDSLDDLQFVQLETMLINLAQDSLTIYDLDGSQKLLVQQIAGTRTPTSYDARNILEAVAGLHYAEDIPGEDDEYIKLAQQHAEDAFKASIMDVFPNPTNGEFTVKYHVATNKPLQLFISDVTGRILFQLQLATEENSLQLDLSNLPEDSYFIGVTDSHTISSVNKIVILK